MGTGAAREKPVKLEDHIQLSRSGVDHYQNKLLYAETITLDASLSAA